MRNLSDSSHYFFPTQWAGLQLQGTIHAQITVSTWLQLRVRYLIATQGAAVFPDTDLLQQSKTPVPWQNDFLFSCEEGVVIKSAKFHRRWIFEWFCSKIELTLLI